MEELTLESFLTRTIWVIQFKHARKRQKVDCRSFDPAQI
jgi:hypothetical protein